MRQRHLSTLVASAALLAASPGCGGGDDTTSTPLTKRDFVSRADALCTDAGSGIAPAYHTSSALIKLRSPSDDQRAQLADALHRYADAEDELVDQLGTLEPPVAFRQEFDRYLKLYGRFNAELRQSATAIEKSSEPPRTVLNRVGSDVGNSTLIAGGNLGFTECLAGD